MKEWMNKWNKLKFIHLFINLFFHFIHSNAFHFNSFHSFIHSFHVVLSSQFISTILFIHLFFPSFLPFLRSFISFHFISFPLISFQLTSFQITNNSCKQTCSYNYVQFLKLLPGRVPGTTWYIYIILLILT